MKTFKEFRGISPTQIVEQVYFKIRIPDMSTMFMKASSESAVKLDMRQKLKPDVVKEISIKRVTKAEMRKIYRAMGQGKEDEPEPTEESTINELSPELARKARDKAQVKRFSGKVGDKYHGQRQSDKFDSYAQRKDVEKKTGIKSPGDALKYWREHGRAPDGWGVSTDEKGKPIKAYKK